MGQGLCHMVYCRNEYRRCDLNPQPPSGDRILSPVRLPYPWYWKQFAAMLKVCAAKPVTTLAWSL